MDALNSFCCSRNGILTGLVIYGCGPNIPIGLLGIAASTFELISEKKTLTHLKKDKEKNDLNPLDNTNYQFKIDILTQKIDVTTEKIKIFAISLIPLVGPLKAFSKILD